MHHTAVADCERASAELVNAHLAITCARAHIRQDLLQVRKALRLRIPNRSEKAKSQ
jgi:hypothetical protein